MKKLINVTLLLLSVGVSGVGYAHETGAQTLGSSITAKDIFRTECIAWGNGIHPAAPADEANGAATKMFATVTVTGGNPATIRVRALPGGLYSSKTSTSTAGNGLHYFVVAHTAAGAHTYNVSFHCENAASAHTGTGYNFVGNPPSVTPTVDFVRTFNQ